HPCHLSDDLYFAGVAELPHSCGRERMWNEAQIRALYFAPAASIFLVRSGHTMACSTTHKPRKTPPQPKHPLAAHTIKQQNLQQLRVLHQSELIEIEKAWFVRVVLDVGELVGKKKRKRPLLNQNKKK